MSKEDLGFIRDDVLRAILERDIAEMRTCAETKAHKAALVLAGSVIEAVLIDALLGSPPLGKTPQDIMKMELGPVIELAKNASVIKPRTRDLCSVVRDYRNLIHPGRELREKEEFDERTVRVALGLVEMVLADLGRAATGGWTAEQMIAKLEEDWGSAAVVDYLAENMSRRERERLLRMIPDYVAERHSEIDGVPPWVSRFVKMHAALAKRMPKDILHSEVSKVKDALGKGRAFDVGNLLRFYVDELDLLPEETINAILAYVFQHLVSMDEEDRWLVKNTCGYEPLGRYISEGNVRIATRALKTVSRGELPEDLIDAVEEISLLMGTKARQILIEWSRKHMTDKAFVARLEQYS